MRPDCPLCERYRNDFALFGERVLCGLAGGAGDERGDDVGGVAVEADSGAVVAHGGARVGVAGCFLDVA